jgi:hypothetical protein
MNAGAKKQREAKLYDYSHFPKEFKTAEDALDTYNELGFAHSL